MTSLTTARNTLLTLLASSALIGCGKGEKTSPQPQTDSIITDSITLEEVSAQEDSLKIYYSDDLKSFRIKGDVLARSAVRHGAETIYPEPTMELTFDSLGNFTGSLQGLYAKKNEEGQNYSYSMNYEDGTSWELTYTEYNDQSYPVKAEIIESGPQGTAKCSLTYYGYEYDREKNWVMRSVSMSREFIETDTEEQTNTFRKWKELVSYTYRQKRDTKNEK